MELLWNAIKEWRKNNKMLVELTSAIKYVRVQLAGQDKIWLSKHVKTNPQGVCHIQFLRQGSQRIKASKRWVDPKSAGEIT